MSVLGLGMKKRLPTVAWAAGALLAAAAAWLPALRLFYSPRLEDYFAATGVPPMARAMAEHHLHLWDDAESRAAEVKRMRRSNAEWDFMGRTYLVLALANLGLRDPAGAGRYLAVMDRIIDETLRLEAERGIDYFLMDYARAGQFVADPPRSLFQDGEIALMLAARRMLAEREDYRPLLAERIQFMTAAMSQSPVLCGESYPNECWMFCNAVALAAMRMSDALDNADHSEFIGKWLETAKARLTDRKTGLLISSFGFDGAPLDGPEGSSIWMAAHCLDLVSPEFAEDQYRRARKELAASFLGFWYAREWPRTWKGAVDVDSGPVVPGLNLSAGSSGLAILGAASFNDTPFLRGLLTSLNYGGFPIWEGGRLRYAASNQVGDAVLLYAMVQGPLWREVARRLQPDKAGNAPERVE